MKKVLYMGDDSLDRAAAYLGGVMAYHKIKFDYVPSVKRLSPAAVNDGIGLFIISDFPAKNISRECFLKIISKVKEGASLLMIGGWESFYGLKGEYHNKPIAEILPVICKKSDDRVNYCHGLIPIQKISNEITSGLPFKRPPVVCGYNDFTAKKDSKTVLSLRKIRTHYTRVQVDKKNIPLLVIGKYGKGKTCAFATDFAPHWVGGLVDWGNKRIKAQAKGGAQIEVGADYARLIKNLITWLLK